MSLLDPHAITYPYPAGTYGFRRATQARYHDASGVVQVAAVDTLRTSHYIGGARRVLVEPAAVNVMGNSQGNMAVGGGGGIGQNLGTFAADAAIVDPAGGATAAKFTEGGTSGEHGIYYYPVIASGVYIPDFATVAFSVYAKAVGRTYLSLFTWTKSGARHQSTANLVTGAWLAFSSFHTDWLLEALAGGWYRVGVSDAVGDGVAHDVGVELYASDASENTNLTGLSAVSFDFWGLQCELNTPDVYPTSYIPTSGGSSSRAADVLQDVSGTGGDGMTEAEVAAGGQQLLVALSNDTFIP